MRRWKHILAYLFLAILGYFIAVSVGGRAAFLVFIAGAAFCELLFWKELLWPKKRDEPNGSP